MTLLRLVVQRTLPAFVSFLKLKCLYKLETFSVVMYSMLRLKRFSAHNSETVIIFRDKVQWITNSV